MPGSLAESTEVIPVIAPLLRMIRRVPTSISNVRNTGLPWYRVVSLYRANIWYKVRYGADCCGNLGHPGC